MSSEAKLVTGSALLEHQADDVHSKDMVIEVDSGRSLIFHAASLETPYVVQNASLEHLQRGSQTVFPFGYLEFQGFDFQRMYDQGTVPRERRILASSENMRILARESSSLPAEIQTQARHSLARMIQIAEETRTEKGLLACQQDGRSGQYVRCIGSIASTLLYGSDLSVGGYPRSTDMSDETLTIVPLKGAALCVMEAFPNHVPGRVVPISSTRVPLESGEFGLGFTLPRLDFSSPIDQLIRSADGKPLRLLEIAIVTGKTTMGFLTLISKYGVKPSQVEIMAPVVAQQGVSNVFNVSRALGLNTKVITYEMFYDLDEPNGNDSLRTADGKLVLGNPPRIAGEIAYNRVNRLNAEFITAHGLEWL